MSLRKNVTIFFCVLLCLTLLWMYLRNNTFKEVNSYSEQQEKADGIPIFDLISSISSDETLFNEVVQQKRSGRYDSEFLVKYTDFHVHMTSNLSLKPSEYGELNQVDEGKMRVTRLFLTYLALDQADRSLSRSNYCASSASYLSTVRLGFSTLTVARSIFEVSGSCATIESGVSGLTNVLSHLDQECLKNVESYLVSVWHYLPQGADAISLPSKGLTTKSVTESAGELISFLYLRDKIGAQAESIVARTRSKILQTLAITMLHRYKTKFEESSDSLQAVLEALEIDKSLSSEILTEFALVGGEIRPGRTEE